MNRVLPLVFLFTSLWASSQEIIPLNTNSLILKAEEQQNLSVLINEDPEALRLYKPIVKEANSYLNDKPSPLIILNYEGMLDTDSARILTEISLSDMAKVIAWYYAYFGDPKAEYGNKIREYVLAWARTYVPTGNTINENKFVPLFWGYYMFKDKFSVRERELVEGWMIDIANHQINRPRTSNNNWQVKRIKIIGLVGGITRNKAMVDTALVWTKKYINTSLFEDGTSNDLRHRDALHYHNSGLKALLTLCINLAIFNERFDLYDYVADGGGSIKKSVEYVIPYALGDKTHKEWVNSKVELDRRRAAAGISKYQTGMLFDPQTSLELFELSCHYDRDHYNVLAHLLGQDKKKYTMTWASMLNSPLVRD